jgi:hypothetical protein
VFSVGDLKAVNNYFNRMLLFSIECRFLVKSVWDAVDPNPGKAIRAGRFQDIDVTPFPVPHDRSKELYFSARFHSRKLLADLFGALA